MVGFGVPGLCEEGLEIDRFVLPRTKKINESPKGWDAQFENVVKNGWLWSTFLLFLMGGKYINAKLFPNEESNEILLMEEIVHQSIW